jgi:hypothetical protein
MAKTTKTEGVAPTGHSRFGASSADRWIECPGSVTAQEAAPPDSTSIYAAEGTAGHEIAAFCLNNNQDAIEHAGKLVAVEGYPEEIEITEDLVEGIQLYLDTVREDKKARGGKLLIERRFQLASLDKEFFGTSDCAALGTDNVLRVYDLKLGKGKAVEVSANRQLCYYALGVIETLPPHIQAKIKEVELTIVQPRRAHKDGPVRRWRCKPTDLLDYCQDLKEAAADARSISPSYKAGEHCGFCRAAATCKTLRAHAHEAAQRAFEEDAISAPSGMSPGELAAVLNQADTIERWISSVRAYAQHLANQGETIPGWKLVDKRATRKWHDFVTEDTFIFDFGLDETSIYDKKLKSPAQIEKILPKEDRPKLAKLYSKISSGTKLARVDDVRQEVSASAQSDFAD